MRANILTLLAVCSMGLAVNSLQIPLLTDVTLWSNVALEVARANFDKNLLTLVIESTRGEERDTVALVCKNLEGDGWTLMITDEQNTQPSDNYRFYQMPRTKALQIIIMIREDLVTFKNRLTEAVASWEKIAVWYSRAKILILLQRHENTEIPLTRALFSELWRSTQASNVVIFEQGAFLTWHPYNPSCNVQVTLIRTWGETLKGLYPEKITGNFNNCTLLATTTFLEPFVLRPENGIFHDGMEIRMMNTLATRLNFSYRYVFPPEGENPWISVVNGSASGLIGLVHRREADIAFFGIRLTWERFQLCDHIDSHFGDELAWAAPLPEPIERWKSFFVVFEINLWLGIGITFIIVAVMISLITVKTRKDSDSSLLLTWSAMMNTITPYNPNNAKLRTFMTFYLLYTLNVIAAYQSGIIRSLTQAVNTIPFNTAIAATQSGLIAAIYPSNSLDMAVSVPKYHSLITNLGLVNWTEDHLNSLRRAIRKRDTYILLPKKSLEYEISKRFTTRSGQPLIRFLDERFKVYNPVFYLSKHHPLTPTFRKSVRQFVEFGWVESHLQGIMMDVALKRRQTSEVSDLEGPDSFEHSFTVEELVGAFFLLILFLIVAGLVFVWEVVWFKYQHKVEKAKCAMNNHHCNITCKVPGSRLNPTVPVLTELHPSVAAQN